jgi:cytidylate kinase
VIAIDGPSGAGKSTAARALAAALGYTFVDTGAMYRALALKALRSGVSFDDGERLCALLAESEIQLEDGGRRVRLDGEDVTEAVRTRAVAGTASQVSVHPGVRRAMVARQKAIGSAGGVVLDGRDIGSAVFPDAEVKFYVDADASERARRRHAEIGHDDASVAEIERDIRERDQKDMSRADSPLIRTADAILIDTTGLSPEAVLQRMLEVVRAAQ